jgi:hypothetical protein
MIDKNSNEVHRDIPDECKGQAIKQLVDSIDADIFETLPSRESQMLPPEGLELKEGDWVELYDGEVYGPLDKNGRVFAFKPVSEHPGTRLTWTVQGSYDSTMKPNKENVRRVLEYHETPEYKEWLESHKDGVAFNCRVVRGKNFTKERWTDSAGIIAAAHYVDGEFIVYDFDEDNDMIEHTVDGDGSYQNDVSRILPLNK